MSVGQQALEMTSLRTVIQDRHARLRGLLPSHSTWQLSGITELPINRFISYSFLPHSVLSSITLLVPFPLVRGLFFPELF